MDKILLALYYLDVLNVILFGIKSISLVDFQYYFEIGYAY